MTYVLSGLLVVVVAILGWILLPAVSFIITIPLMLILRFINKVLAYMVSRYAGLAFDFVVMIWLITWAGARWDLVTWPAWTMAGWCMFTAGNTLILFDIRCYVTESGIWAPIHIE
jgi:hypothetical protein